MKSCATQLFFLTLLLSWLCLIPAARAHQPGLSTVQVNLGSNRLTAQLIFAWPELDAMVPMDANRWRSTVFAVEIKVYPAGTPVAVKGPVTVLVALNTVYCP